MARGGGEETKLTGEVSDVDERVRGQYIGVVDQSADHRNHVQRHDAKQLLGGVTRTKRILKRHVELPDTVVVRWRGSGVRLAEAGEYAR